MKINYRQVSLLVMMSFISVKLMALPSLLSHDADNMGWIVPAVMMLVDFVYALLLLDLMKKNETQNFYEFAKQTLGVVVAKIVLAILACYYAIVLAIIGKGLELFIIQNLYEEMFWFLFGVPLMAVVGFMVYKGVRNIARVCEFFWIPVVVACVYIAVKAFQGVDITSFLPMFQQGVKPVAWEMIKYIAWFGSSTFLLMLFGDVEFGNAKKRNLILFCLVAYVVVQLLNFVFYSLFGVTSPTHQFSISDIAQFNGSRSSIGELSWLVVSLWVVAQIAQFALYGYCFVKAIMFLFNIKSPTVGILFLYAYIIFWGVWGTKTMQPEIIFYQPITSWLTIVVAYILPIVLWIGHGVNVHKQKVKNAKQQTEQQPIEDTAGQSIDNTSNGGQIKKAEQLKLANVENKKQKTNGKLKGVEHEKV